MFEKFKTTKEMCEEFKKKAFEFSAENGNETNFVVDIADLDSFFHYDSSKYKTYIKKGVKDTLVKMGIRFEKILGREQVWVKIEA